MDKKTALQALQQMRYAETKLPGGKLVQVAIEYDETIKSIHITGDFFIHPEEGIKDIETALIGKALDEVQDTLTHATKDMELIGITTQAIEDLIRQCGE